MIFVLERTLTKSALPTSYWMEEHFYVFKRQCRRVYSAILSRVNFSPVTFKKTGRIMSCYVNIVTLMEMSQSCWDGRDLGFNLEPLDR